MERRSSGTPRPWPLDHGDPRTPMAWQYRNINYHQQQSVYNDHYGLDQHPSNVGMTAVAGTDPYVEEMRRNEQYRSRQHPQTRPMSPSTETSTASSSTAEPDTVSQLKYNPAVPFQPDVIAGTQPALGTLYSMQSTLSTWNGELCPVHHMPLPVPMFIPSPTPPQNSLLAMPPPPPPPPPPMLLPPMLRPQPLVLPAENPAPPEPLPVRDPKASVSPLPPKNSKQNSIHCCKGHIIVLWVILSIIFTGVLLGVILRFVIASMRLEAA